MSDSARETSGKAFREQHAVAIVGAGPVGLLLGCLLAGRGVDVVVLERRTARRLGGRAIGIHPAGLAALDAAGVGAAVRREAATIRLGIARSRGRLLGRLAFDESQRACTLPQARTEAILEARLRALAPGALRRGVDVTGIRDRGDRIEVDAIEGGRAAGFAAAWLVGADGLRSLVRAEVGDWVPVSRGAEYAMTDERGTALDDEAARLYLEPEGVVESFPLPDHGRRWVIRLAAATGGLGPAEFAAIVERRSGHTIRRSGPPPSRFTARQHRAEPFARGRLALVGDAAHEISPIGGQGMNVGWLDAIELDRALAAARRDPGRAAPFQGYARRRDAAARRAMRRAAFDMAMGAPIDGWRRRLRDAVVRLLASAAPRRIATGLVTMRRGRGG